MQKRKWILGVVALAALIGVSGTASAQFACPVPTGQGQFQFGAQDLIDAASASGATTANALFAGLLGVWPGILDGYDDFDGADSAARFADAKSEVPFLAEGFLITAIASNSSLSIQGQSTDVYGVVCAEWVETLNLVDQIAFTGDLNLFNLAVANSVVKLTALDIMFADDQTDYDGRVTSGLTSDTNQSAPGAPVLGDFSFSTVVGGLLPDAGDLDNDSKTNLVEWQEACDANPADIFAAIDEWVATMLAGSAVTINVSGPSEVFTSRVSGTFSAVTAYPESFAGTADTTYNWSSTDTAVVTVNSATGLTTTATGVAPGTAQIRATGNNTAVAGNKSVTVRVPEWFEVCELGTLFAGEGEALAGSLGCDLVDTPVFNDDRFDAEFDIIGFTGIVGDGARDAFQVQLLAYTMCALGGQETAPQFTPSKSFVGDANDVVADYLANFDDLEAFVGNAQRLSEWFIADSEEVKVSGGTTITLDQSTTTVLTASSENGGDTAFAFFDGSASLIGFDADPLNVVSLSGATATQVTVTGAPGLLTTGGQAYVYVVGATTNIVKSVLINVRLTTPAPGPAPGPVDDCGDPIVKGNFSNLDTRTFNGVSDVPFTTGFGVTAGLIKDLDTMNDNIAAAKTEIDSLAPAVPAGTGAAIEGAVNTFADPSTLALLTTLGGEDGIGFLASSIGTVAHLSAALGGLSTEYSVTTNLLLDGQALASVDIPGLFAAPGGDIFQLVYGLNGPGQLKAQVDGMVAGVEGFTGFPIAATHPAIATLQANINAAAATAARLNSGNPGDPDDFTVPTWRIYGQGAKLSNEPFSGSGDWDGDGVTNAQVSQAVSGANGDSLDFVNGAAGLTPFWAGNPGLPAAGFLGLGLLAGALATGGAIVVRRRK